MLSVGIIGLPNVGKSTLFNALTRGHAAVSNYPFTTIDSNLGVVPVPDPRLERLADLLAPEETTPAFIRFIDIAGLVEGASRGEGLGNQFLGNIRQVDAVAHVVRAFASADVAHVYADVDPVRDVEVIETELLLADLEVLGRTLEKRQREWKADPKGHEKERERLELYRRTLEAGEPLAGLDLDEEARRELKGLGLLTGKPTLWVLNVSEGEPGPEERAAVEALQRRAGEGAAAVEVSAKIEGELVELEPEERREFMAALGLERTGLERVVAESFRLLDLIRFYTVVSGKLRAWEVARGTRAPQAAGEIHSDMERGFIRAQVAHFADLAEHGSFQELHHHGLLRTEGKDYEVQDGDVVEFLFKA
jgi:GTP-binding protein YchF